MTNDAYRDRKQNQTFKQTTNNSISKP